MTFLDAMTAHDRNIARGRERLSCRKRQVLHHFRTRGSDPRAAIWALRQAVVSLKMKGRTCRPDPWVRPAGQPKTTRGSWWLDQRVTHISRVMTQPDPTRDISKPLDPTRPDPTREISKPLDPTRPDPTREISKPLDPTRPDPLDFKTS